MSSYRSERSESTIGHDFANQLRAFLDRKLQHGRDGLDLNAIYDGKKASRTVYRRFRMDDSVFDLGCEINRKFPDLDYRLWGSWMTNTSFKESPEVARFYVQSDFTQDYIQKTLGKYLRSHFSKPVEFVLDPSIRAWSEAV